MFYIFLFFTIINFLHFFFFFFSTTTHKNIFFFFFFAGAENKNDKYFVKRINGIKDENIERKFFENTKQFKNLMHEVKIKLGQEVTEILGNLEE